MCSEKESVLVLLTCEASHLPEYLLTLMEITLANRETSINMNQFDVIDFLCCFCQVIYEPKLIRR